MSPPVAVMATPASGRTSETAPREALLRDAMRLMAACGIVRSHAWTRQVVRDYSRATIRGLPFGPYLAARLELNAQQRAALYTRPEDRYVLTYSDPTGEEAIRHVPPPHGRGHRPH